MNPAPNDRNDTVEICPPRQYCVQLLADQPNKARTMDRDPVEILGKQPTHRQQLLQNVLNTNLKAEHAGDEITKEMCPKTTSPEVFLIHRHYKWMERNRNVQGQTATSKKVLISGGGYNETLKL